MVEILNIHESGGNEFKRLASAANGSDRNVLVQRGEFALFAHG